jgi:hypothetical protein
LGGWVLHPGVNSWICWKESQVNSEGRRLWTRQAAEFFRSHYRPGDGVLTAAGDVTAVYQQAGLRLRDTLSDGPAFDWAVARPDLFLHERSFRVNSPQFAPWFEPAAQFSAQREPVIEIYRKIK